MADLPGWNASKKIILDIDYTKIDSTLTDFPVRISLSNSSGLNSSDLTLVFTEVGSNSKKIAVTTSDGTTECYVEIENWDNASKEAELWVKVPTTSSTVDTTLYLYYDNTHADNTTYVGTVGESPAQSVWDSNFLLVYHMNQDPSGGSGAIKDSTSNVNNGTSSGSMTSGDLLAGQIGKGLDFDGVDDYINVGTGLNSQFATNSSYSWFAVVKIKDSAANKTILSNTDWSSPYIGNGLLVESDGDLRVDIGENASNLIRKTYTATLEDDTLHQVGYTYDGSYNASGLTLYVDGSSVSATTNYDTVVGTSTSTTNLQVTGRDGANEKFFGLVDEVRLSSIVRSSSWIKADNYSNTNGLITFTVNFANFSFISPSLYGGNKYYGLLQDLSLIVTISGSSPSYLYDASFYTGLGQQIGSTVSGIPSGNLSSVQFPTTSGVVYDWYLTATSSGFIDTSSTYNFYIRYLCSGICESDGIPASGINVRLYKRDTGDLVGSTTSAGTGSFYIDSPYNENHYAIALHDDTNTNALIYDKIKPE